MSDETPTVNLWHLLDQAQVEQRQLEAEVTRLTAELARCGDDYRAAIARAEKAEAAAKRYSTQLAEIGAILPGWVLCGQDIAGCVAQVVKAAERRGALLAEVESVLALMEHPKRPDPAYHERVERLSRDIGYGVIMSTAEVGWRESLAKKGHPVGGEFVCGPCRGTIDDLIVKVRAELSPAPAPPARYHPDDAAARDLGERIASSSAPSPAGWGNHLDYAPNPRVSEDGERIEPPTDPRDNALLTALTDAHERITELEAQVECLAAKDQRIAALEAQLMAIGKRLWVHHPDEFSHQCRLCGWVRPYDQTLKQHFAKCPGIDLDALLGADKEEG